MTTLEIIVMGAVLSMDACAVAMSNGMVYHNIKKRHIVAMPILFALFQGMMPLIGYYTGTLLNGIMDSYSGAIILLILGAIGCRMVYNGFKHDDDPQVCKLKLTFTVLLMQAVATSIDALAVGVAFTAMRVEIITAVSIIAIVTAFLVVSAILLGKWTAKIFGSKAEIIGGIILILIGIKAVL